MKGSDLEAPHSTKMVFISVGPFPNTKRIAFSDLALVYQAIKTRINSALMQAQTMVWQDAK